MRHLLLLAALVLPVSASAELSLGSPFTEHMMLQAGEPVRIFGHDDPGQEVTITLAGESVTATADGDGRWLAELPAMEAPGPHAFSAEGSSSVAFEDVVLGDLWWCGGQSNMEFTAKRTAEADEIVDAPADPMLRLFKVRYGDADEPLDTVTGEWTLATPEEAANFSGVGLGFGRILREKTDRPIGMVSSSRGGSQISAWIPDDRLVDLPEGTIDREKDAAEAAEQAAATAAWEAGGKEGKKPVVSEARAHRQLSRLYNGMISGLGPMNLRGLLWYQGESDSKDPAAYRVLYPILLDTLRSQFQNDELPAYAVQLPGFKSTRWPAFRLAQSALAADDALQPGGLVIAIDTGMWKEIHPPSKAAVSDRLARLALRDVYGQDVVAEGPKATDAEIVSDGDTRIVLTFDGGPVSVDRVEASEEEGTGFEIVESDETVSSVEVLLVEGNRIELAVPGGAAPVTVRFGRTPFPPQSIHNEAGLPAAPFALDLELE